MSTKTESPSSLHDRTSGARRTRGAAPGHSDIATETRYLCVDAAFNLIGRLHDNRLAGFTERHKAILKIDWTDNGDIRKVSRNISEAGVVLVANEGWLGRPQIRFCRDMLRRGLKTYVYWPNEHAIEVVDEVKLRSFWKLWLAVKGFQLSGKVDRLKQRVRNRLANLKKRKEPPIAPNDAPPTSVVDSRVTAVVDEVRLLMEHAKPIPLPLGGRIPTPVDRLPGTGLYLRTDYWVRISSGGSYGHTAYVARSLRKVTEKLTCIFPFRFDLIDEFDEDIRQIITDTPCQTCNTEDLFLVNKPYYQMLKTAFQVIEPTYIYERLCQGNYIGAKLSQELGIPYIVEYNGSETMMKRSFDGGEIAYEDELDAVEMFAFKQATLISVISQAVGDDLIRRGVDPAKILVNPNGVDVDDYRPLTAEPRRAVREPFGWTDEHCVVGFTGTFGRWHGVGVLAEAMPQIAKQAPHVRFMMIGNGHCVNLIEDAVRNHRLESRVHMAGRVPQSEGRRLLGTCDVFVAPHDSDMAGSKFFGSPTKLFEYLGMGGAIVASRLEQIGEVLSPALGVKQLLAEREVDDRRAVLCEPGSVQELIDAVVRLANRPKVRAALGKNARNAAIDEFSWDKHVERLWRFELKMDGAQWIPLPATDVELPEAPVAEAASPTVAAVPKSFQRIQTGDVYKDEVQNQWNDNPCGSHYGGDNKQETLEWFLQVEKHRYGEYAPWMPKVMEFAEHRGHKVLEVGAGMGTDLAQFAKHGADCTDIDLSAGHLALAQRNFALRGLQGTFIHHDAEARLPFDDNTFDVVYSNGVIHHTPHTAAVVKEMHRVLKPGGKAIVMVYAENSIYYWRTVRDKGLYGGELNEISPGETMSRYVEMSSTNTKPLVKVYTARGLKRLFQDFKQKTVCKRQLTEGEKPQNFLRRLPVHVLERFIGWNLIIKATK